MAAATGSVMTAVTATATAVENGMGAANATVIADEDRAARWRAVAAATG
ncbi:hypothetical protein GTZ78_48185, partial [Streptomyces sp. SID8361]|nr:hypothetical protein [Streptomyces sp. SID8361]